MNAADPRFPHMVLGTLRIISEHRTRTVVRAGTCLGQRQTRFNTENLRMSPDAWVQSQEQALRIARYGLVTNKNKIPKH